jgi:hypothetical protein
VVPVCVDEVSAPPELLQVVFGPVSDSPADCVDDVGLGTAAGGVSGRAVGRPPAGVVALGVPLADAPSPDEFGDADDEFDDASVPVPSARATPGVFATHVATPSAAASAPTRPTYRE